MAGWIALGLVIPIYLGGLLVLWKGSGIILQQRRAAKQMREHLGRFSDFATGPPTTGTVAEPPDGE